MLSCTQEPTSVPHTPVATGVLECVRRYEFADGRNLEEVIDRIPGLDESSRQVTELFIERIIFLSSYKDNRALIVTDPAELQASELGEIFNLVNKTNSAQIFSIANLAGISELAVDINNQKELKPLILDIAVSNVSQLPKILETIKLTQFTQLAGREVKVERIYLIEDKANLDTTKALLAEIIPSEEVSLLRKLALETNLAEDTFITQDISITETLSDPISQAQELIMASNIDMTNVIDQNISVTITNTTELKEAIQISLATNLEESENEVILEPVNVSEKTTLIEAQENNSEQYSQSTQQHLTSIPVEQLSDLSFSFNWNELAQVHEIEDTLAVPVANKETIILNQSVSTSNWISIKQIDLNENGKVLLPENLLLDSVNNQAIETPLTESLDLTFDWLIDDSLLKELALTNSEMPDQAAQISI
jgi:hypothetical protein